MRTILLLLLTLSLQTIGLCQSISTFQRYSSRGIADSLQKNADAVYRIDEGSLDIQSTSKYIYKVHNIITLLNKKAERHLRLSLGFDKQNKVEDVTVAIYDSTGLKISEYKKKDLKTVSYNDNMSIYTDDKILYLQVSVSSYPCTVETTYEMRTTGYVNLPDWYVASPGESVEQSFYTVKVPANLDIRHKTFGEGLKATVVTEGDAKIYKWTANNIVAPEKTEEDGYERYEDISRIEISPTQFEYDGYKGDLKTWQTYGAWNYALYEEARPFDEVQTREITDMVANCKTDVEKITVLYNHLKKTMRYVSVQLGIGGLKPFPVQYVYKNKYGDCKALTNYMRYMLKTAGINAYPALVNAGSSKRPVDVGFPTQNFNHVILCVPLAKDSVWLECTSNNNKAGVLGSFTENKNVLLLTEKGGVIASTPRSKSVNNQLNTKTTVELNEDGSSKVTSSLYCTGDFWNMFFSIDQLDNADKKTIFTNYLKYKMPDEFSLIQKADSLGGASFNLNLSYDQSYSFKTGSKLFYDQRINKLCNEDVKPLIRKQDYLFDFPYQKTDTTIYILPQGVTADQLPSKKEISTDYINYSSECKRDEIGNKIYVISTLSLKQRAIPPNDYLHVAETFRQVNQNESQKIVMKKL